MSLTITLLNKELNQKVTAFSSLVDYEVSYTLLAEIVRSEMMNLRTGNAHTKTRAEVRGGGRKPWKQKGTGRARHGSTRSPIWVGGGVCFGPRNTVNWHCKINKTARIAALKSILKDRLSGEVVYVLPSGFELSLTKNALSTIGTVRVNEAKSDKQTTLVYTTADKDMIRGFLNTDVKMMNVDQLKIATLVNTRTLVFTPTAKEILETKLK